VSQWFQQQFSSENRHAIVLQVSSSAGSCQEISKYEDVFGRRSVEALEVYTEMQQAKLFAMEKKYLCKIVCTTQPQQSKGNTKEKNQPHSKLTNYKKSNCFAKVDFNIRLPHPLFSGPRDLHHTLMDPALATLT